VRVPVEPVLDAQDVATRGHSRGPVFPAPSLTLSPQGRTLASIQPFSVCGRKPCVTTDQNLGTHRSEHWQPPQMYEILPLTLRLTTHVAATAE